MNDGGDFRTALAKPGLLKSYMFIYLDWVFCIKILETL